MENNIIEKSNVLNAMQQTNYDMTLNEFRFFCMYLSKLNARDPSNRTAIIKIEDFEKLFDTKFNTSRFNKKIRQVAGANIEIKTGDKTTILQLYSKFEWCDSEDCKELEITCNFDVQPYLFELQKNYTAYRLGNIAKLNSISKIRLYELCKQYEKIKEVKFEIEELQQMLMTRRNRFNDLRLQVIEPAIKDINEFTDIKVTYEKVLKCRKCIAIKFFIESKNTGTITEQEQEQKEPEIETSDLTGDKKLRSLYNQYFSSEQEEMFKNNIKSMLKSIYKIERMATQRAKAIYEKSVISFETKVQTTDIKNPVSYMQGIINNLLEKESRNPQKLSRKFISDSDDSTDVETFAINYWELPDSEKRECDRGITKKQAVQAITEPVKEKRTIPEKIETTDNEPAGTSDEVLKDIEPYSEFFKTENEESDLCLKAMRVIDNTSSYDDAIKFLDIVDERWRHFDGFFKIMITDKLAEKTGAPELVEI